MHGVAALVQIWSMHVLVDEEVYSVKSFVGARMFKIRTSLHNTFDYSLDFKIVKVSSNSR